MPQRRSKKRVKSVAVVVGAIALIGLIIWLDIATGVWNDLVIMAGLAAGLVTFLLTVLVLDKIIARSTERKWAPVTRLALTDFLHSLADEKHSEVSRGHIVPRSLPSVESIEGTEALHDSLHTLRHEVVRERHHLTDLVGRWAEFLSSSGDNGNILRHVADLALRLDLVRDLSVELEQAPSGSRLTALNSGVQRCNDLLVALADELKARIAHEDQLTRNML